MPAIIEKSPNNKPLGLKILESVLLVIVLSLIMLRATYIENPHVDQMEMRTFLSSQVVSLFISSVLLVCFAIWLFVSLCMNQFRWRKTWLGLAVGLFVLAGIISFFAASNKRAAITDLVLLAAPMLSAVFLIQLLTSRQKIRFALLLILAVGVVATAQCIDQLYASNDEMIQDYERNPLEQIEKFGYEPDSLEHWMYEHRLYSKDIRGFLMTSNSAASFFLLAAFAGLGLCIEAFRQRKHAETLAAFVCYSLAFLFAVGGLVMTQSKGGNGAFVLGLFLFILLGFFGKRLWKYRIVLGILLLIVIVSGSMLVIIYGCQHNRLPGGNSMLVRWQYWQSTAQMIGDHFWTGVGGGNFSFLYPLYKNPAASETIQDPHNIILSLLSQYGPLGLLAFLAAVLWPMWKGLQQRFTESDSLAAVPQSPDKKLWLGLLTLSVCMLLFVRPLLVDISFLQQSAGVSSAAYVVLYVFPAGVFILAFGLLCVVAGGDASIQKPNYGMPLAILCGLIAVLIHNLIDFAIFEPGVWNTFWLFVAILIAIVHTNRPQDDNLIMLQGGTRIFMILGLIAIIVGYFAVVVTPPIKSMAGLNRLRHTASIEEFEEEIQNALAADVLSPDLAYDAARMLMQMSPQQSTREEGLSVLEKAAGYATVVQQRNPASFKPYRLEGEIELMLAQETEIEHETKYLQRAYEAFLQAIARYPVSDRIHYSLGQIAEKLGRSEQALAHYQKAIEIELAYQAQFKVMYPERDPVISRLGNTSYTIAQAKIKELKKQLQE